jgi:hypothetical protein
MTRFISTHPRTPLARRLAVRLGVIGLALVMGVSSIVVLVDYQMLKQRAVERLDQIEVSYLASVAENVWLQDRERLTQLVEGIRQLAFIQMAEVRDEHGQLLLRVIGRLPLQRRRCTSGQASDKPQGRKPRGGRRRRRCLPMGIWRFRRVMLHPAEGPGDRA